MKDRMSEGTPVTVKLGGRTYAGKVISAVNYGTEEEPNWYVEIRYPDGDYGYWKQKEDGGTVTFGETS